MYQFFLYHPDLKRMRRIADPVDWDSLGKEYDRDPKLMGVFFKYSPKLRFVKNGRDLAHYFYEKYFIAASMTLIVYKKNRATRRYELYYTGKLNFTNARISTLYFECNVEQTGFIQRFKNSQDIKVNVVGTPGDRVTIEMHSRKIQRASKSQVLFGDSISDQPFNSPSTLYLMHTTAGNEADDIDERQDYGTEISELNPVEVSKYIYLAKEAGSYAFDIIEGFSLIAGDDGFNFEVQWKLVHGKPGNYTTVNIGVVESAAGTSIVEGLKTLVTTVELEKDDEVYVFGEVDLSGNPGGLTLSYLPLYNPTPGEDENIVYSRIYVNAATVVPATNATGVLWYEAFEKTVADNTGQQGAFKSDYYGRVDNGYAADGEGALKLLLNGSLIRGFDPDDRGLHISFKDLLDGAVAIDGVGVGIEHINGRETVVIEKLSHFFAPRRVARLSYVRDIEKEVAEEFIYNQIDGGYDKWSDEQVGNLDEHNAKRDYKLPVTELSKKLDLRSKIIAGGYPIETIRRQNITLSETKDNDRDNEHFVVQLVRTETGYETERNQNGVSALYVLNVDTAYNIRLSPMRNIIRNGERIRSGLYKLDEEYITLTDPQGNANAQTTLAVDDPLLSERQIQVKALAKPLWIPEFYSFKTELTPDLQSAIETDPYGYLEFSADGKNWKRGYVMNIKPDTKSDLTTFKLLRANL
jgi:hypothetical protein